MMILHQFKMLLAPSPAAFLLRRLGSKAIVLPVLNSTLALQLQLQEVIYELGLVNKGLPEAKQC
jgi:hypothetical protein